MVNISIQRLVLGAVLLAGTACQDLDIVNTQNPDLEEVLSNSEDVQTLIAGNFSPFWAAVHGYPGGAGDCCQINHAFMNSGPEMTTTNTWWATVPTIRQPRGIFNNAPDIPNFTGPHGPRTLWARVNTVLSSASDGLRAIRVDGMDFGSASANARAEAFSKFMQGVAWGYQSMIFDRVVVIPEDEPLETLPALLQEQVLAALTPYAEARELAVEAIEDAIRIAQETPFTFPSAAESRSWFATPGPMTSEQFIQLANTMAARILVLNARTPQEREQVQWDRVLGFTANGLTSDFATTLDVNSRTSSLYRATQGRVSQLNCCYRLNYTIIGPADVSGTYQDWRAANLGGRDRFDIVTPDRRVTGADPTSGGAYTAYTADNSGFDPTVGTYLFSAYQWRRHAYREGITIATQTAFDQGNAPLVTADENNLLRAEALLRMGDLSGAAALINITRERKHILPDGVEYDGLPPVTAAGVPQSEDCVPRTDTGVCGDLLTALRYERMLELVGLDGVRGYADGRGFGILEDGTFLQQPIPGNELELLLIPIYSWGGANDVEFGAVYDPVTLP